MGDADTNAAWLGRELAERGIRVARRWTVGDVDEDIRDAIRTALGHADLVLVTGGLVWRGIVPVNDALQPVGKSEDAMAVAYDLGFTPLKDEEYDFLSLRDRLEREPVVAFLEVLRSAEFRNALAELPGFMPDDRTGEPES